MKVYTVWSQWVASDGWPIGERRSLGTFARKEDAEVAKREREEYTWTLPSNHQVWIEEIEVLTFGRVMED